MSSESSELERLLPLLDDVEDSERERIQALLALAGPEDQALFEAYQADEAALAAFARTQRGDVPVMAGFADSVMDRIAAEASAVEAPRVSQAKDEEKRTPAPILRPVFGAQLWIVAAAVLVAGLGLGIVFSSPAAPEAPRRELAETSEPAPALEPVAEAETETQQPGAGPRLAAPARPGLRRARRQRTRPGIVPVDGRGGAQQGRQMLQELLRLQGWAPKTRVPPLAEGEEQVDF